MGEFTKHYGDSPYGGDQQYPNPQYAELGSWNPTHNDSAPDTNEFYAVKNLRMQTPGQYNQRSGYSTFPFAADPASIVLSKSEYSCDYNSGTILAPVVRPDGFDVTLYFDPVARTVRAIFFNKVTQTIQITIDVATGLTDEPQSVMASGIQYESYFLVTIYNHGLYAIYPNTTLLTRSGSPSAWKVVQLGKNLAKPPMGVNISFAPTVTGDLLVKQSHDNGNNNQKLDYQPGLVEAPILRLSVQAKYWLTTDPVFANVLTFPNHNLQKQWEWNKNDPTNYDTNAKIPLSSKGHLETNAWGYRVVFIRSYNDVRGNPITFRSQASVDFWVPNRYYMPAYLAYNGQFGTNAGDFANWGHFPGAPNGWDFPAPIYPKSGTANGALQPPGNAGSYQNVLDGAPTRADLIALSNAYRGYFHSDKDVANSGGAVDPYKFTAMYLGWRDSTSDVDAHWNGNTPYLMPVSAYDLKKAPMTVLSWAMFSGAADFPSDVIKIEVYRTAFNGTGVNEPTAKFGNGDPLFQPHLYGYVGSIEKNGTFTDDVSDALGAGSGGSAIDFAKTPERYDGYLAGQFSGKVLREYNAKIALGNIISNYWVFAPAAMNGTVDNQQAIAVLLTPNAGTIGVNNANSTININGTKSYYYQYEDDAGNVSDISPVIVYIDPVVANNGGAGLGTVSNIFFKIPKGYAPNITKVNIICSDSTGVPGYYLVAQVNTTEDFYNFAVTTPYVQVTPYTKITSPQGAFNNVKQSVEPGGIIYGEGNQIWSFPFTNIEIVNKIFGITAMEAIIGRLWVWTNRTLNLTILNLSDPQGEEETVFAGNLGFNSLVKANKIVFFMSAHGLYFAESSGIVPFPVKVQNEILPYLNEVIVDPTGVKFLPGLSNAARCAVSWLGQRDELWVHFPSSYDLWLSMGWTALQATAKSLPERTFIYKLWNGKVQEAINYEFELINKITHPILNPFPPNLIVRPVIFKNHSDGTLYSAYLDPTGVISGASLGSINIMNNDVPLATWGGQTVLEKRLALGFPNRRKKMRSVSFRADGKNKLWLVTGRPYPEGATPPMNTPDYYGDIYKGNDTGANGGVKKYPLDTGITGGQPQTKRKRIRGINTAESTAYIPAIRLVSEPDALGNHTITYYSLGVDLTIHDHP